MNLIKTPNHLAIIMDGNGRWAKDQNVNLMMGHKRGAENIKNVIKNVIQHKIKFLTLYALSTENLKRPSSEVANLIRLLEYYLRREQSVLHENKIRLQVIGDLSYLSPELRSRISEAISLTKGNDQLNLYIAFCYGSRQELVHACQKIIDAKIKKEDLNTAIFEKFLYASDMPNVDLLIRTGGDQRISNFLLWQLAYAELYFTNVYWPDFSEQDLYKALREYSSRVRNFGNRKINN